MTPRQHSSINGSCRVDSSKLQHQEHTSVASKQGKLSEQSNGNSMIDYSQGHQNFVLHCQLAFSLAKNTKCAVTIHSNSQLAANQCVTERILNTEFFCDIKMTKMCRKSCALQAYCTQVVVLRIPSFLRAVFSLQLVKINPIVVY